MLSHKLTVSPIFALLAVTGGRRGRVHEEQALLFLLPTVVHCGD